MTNLKELGEEKRKLLLQITQVLICFIAVIKDQRNSCAWVCLRSLISMLYFVGWQNYILVNWPLPDRIHQHILRDIFWATACNSFRGFSGLCPKAALLITISPKVRVCTWLSPCVRLSSHYWQFEPSLEGIRSNCPNAKTYSVIVVRLRAALTSAHVHA